MTTKSRIAKLESLKAAVVLLPSSNITGEAWERSLNTLAEALGDITGDEVTRAEVDEALKRLSDDNSK